MQKNNKFKNISSRFLADRHNKRWISARLRAPSSNNVSPRIIIAPVGNNWLPYDSFRKRSFEQHLNLQPPGNNTAAKATVHPLAVPPTRTPPHELCASYKTVAIKCQRARNPLSLDDCRSESQQISSSNCWCGRKIYSGSRVFKRSSTSLICRASQKVFQLEKNDNVCLIKERLRRISWNLQTPTGRLSPFKPMHRGKK